MSEFLPGDLSPDGKLRLRDPVEMGWEIVEPPEPTPEETQEPDPA